jgi:hypothetical protein
MAFKLDALELHIGYNYTMIGQRIFHVVVRHTLLNDKIVESSRYGEIIDKLKLEGKRCLAVHCEDELKFESVTVTVPYVCASYNGIMWTPNFVEMKTVFNKELNMDIHTIYYDVNIVCSDS